MAIVSGAYANFLGSEFHDAFVDIGEDLPREYPQLVTVKDMEYQTEKELQISGLGSVAEKPEGNDFITDEPDVGGTKTYTAKAFGLAVQITTEMMRDEQFGVMEGLNAELARAHNNKLELDVASIFDDAFTTTVVGFTAGEALCSTAHVAIDGSTNANRPEPDVGLSIAAIQDAITTIHKHKNERGRHTVLRPKLALVVPDDIHVAREIFGSDKAPDNANNALNSLIADYLQWMVHHFQASTTAWFLLSDKSQHGLTLRIKDSVEFFSWFEYRNLSMYIASWDRHTQGYNTWRGVFGSK